MADKYPVTSRTDVLPSGGDIPSPKKKGQESFDEAMNPPNDPQKRYQPDSYNVTYDYCDDQDKDDN